MHVSYKQLINDGAVQFDRAFSRHSSTNHEVNETKKNEMNNNLFIFFTFHFNMFIQLTLIQSNSRSASVLFILNQLTRTVS